jgi:hypothetical protein
LASVLVLVSVSVQALALASKLCALRSNQMMWGYPLSPCDSMLHPQR